ncbi:hypothetical protein D5086_001762 [Populus alba]|uniref:Uncharacterized protein n=1 Tax=Populus alba TaxID=43335 RepID=A0ACC4CZK8_POPAL
MNGHGEEEQQIAFEIYVVVAKRNVEEEEENCDCIEFLMKELRNVGSNILDIHVPPLNEEVTLFLELNLKVPITDVVSLTKTLDSVNSVVPGASSVFGAESQALDGCHGFLASNNMNFTQRTLVVASPQLALSSFQLPLAGGVNGHSFSVVPPGGSEQGSPPLRILPD